MLLRKKLSFVGKIQINNNVCFFIADDYRVYFDVFIRNTKKKVDELIKDLQDYTTQIEKEINRLIREINNNNQLVVNKTNELNDQFQ